MFKQTKKLAMTLKPKSAGPSPTSPEVICPFPHTSRGLNLYDAISEIFFLIPNGMS